MAQQPRLEWIRPPALLLVNSTTPNGGTAKTWLGEWRSKKSFASNFLPPSVSESRVVSIGLFPRKWLCHKGDGGVEPNYVPQTPTKKEPKWN